MASVIVVGAGPAGYAAAIRAAQLGATVTLIEKEWVGGTCLNIGCIPTKAWVRSAEVFSLVRDAEDFGIMAGSPKPDFPKIKARKDQVVSQLVSGIEQLIKANRIEHLKGQATILSDRRVHVAGQDLDVIREADFVFLATGSKPKSLSIPGAKLPGVVTSRELLSIEDQPQGLVVVGGGVVGMEFASIFSALGTKVTVMEFGSRILAHLDKDVSKRMQLVLKKKGIDFHLNTQVKFIEEGEKGLKIVAEGKKGMMEVEADQVLMATGRIASFDEKALREADIQFESDGILVNSFYQTNQTGVYAIGDCNGICLLAHSASHQAVAAVEHALLQKEPVDHVVPSCVFTLPEVSSVGLTEELCKRSGQDCRTSKFSFAANGKAVSLGAAEGFVKWIANEEGRLLGAQIMGPHASDLIHEAALAIDQGMDAADVFHMVHAHPTLSEAVHEAAGGLLGQAIHIAPARKRR
jgi:dihydrolipoamide dehydrogenase